MKLSLSPIAVAVLLATPVSIFAQAPEPQTEFRKTLNAASKEKKLAFVLLGRPSCGNCNATKAMVKAGKINVTAADFVMGDLNIDDPKTEGDFTRKYRKEEFGNVLPFVVITDSTGKALESSSGAKSADAWNAMIASAKAKAGSKPGASAEPKSDWPFKTPAKPQ